MKKQFVSPWYEYLFVVLIVVLSAMICYFIRDFVGYRVLSFVLLFVVSILAFIYGTGPVLLASTLSALTWNFFFIPPHYTLHIDITEDLLMFVMFFIVALLNGVLTSQVRHRESIIRLREERTQALYQLTKSLLEENDVDELKKMIVSGIKKYFHVDSFVFLLEDIPDVYQDNRYTYYPMMGSHMKTGMIVLQHQNKFTEDEMQFWEAYLSQISGRFEREMLNSIAQKAFILDESDKLYKTLFNSISHEFRIPVTTILGATDTLMSEEYAVEIQQQLLAEINIASIRLNQLIENLLNISRLESGHLTLRTNWYDFHDLIDKVTNTLKHELQHYNLIVNIPDDLPMVKIDFGLIEQAMHNLLLNITQYVPQNTDILMDIYLSGDVLKIKLTDQGAGFSPDNIEHVFDKFYRGKSVKTGGTGLGLSIVKGFIEAHKGQVIVYNHPSQGAVFEIEIPVEISNINYIEKLS
ncbi:MAG: DUF4118 domain-containing protein [Paludibacter sp.]|nr:DUF4118 domain-containing protein [Paludibacter sp.]